MRLATISRFDSAFATERLGQELYLFLRGYYSDTDPTLPYVCVGLAAWYSGYLCGRGYCKRRNLAILL